MRNRLTLRERSLNDEKGQNREYIFLRNFSYCFFSIFIKCSLSLLSFFCLYLKLQTLTASIKLLSTAKLSLQVFSPRQNKTVTSRSPPSTCPWTPPLPLRYFMVLGTILPPPHQYLVFPLSYLHHQVCHSSLHHCHQEFPLLSCHPHLPCFPVTTGLLH